MTVDINEDLNLYFTDSDNVPEPSFSQSSRTGSSQVYREIRNEEFPIKEEELLTNAIQECTRDLTLLPGISHKKLHRYMVEDTLSVVNRSRGTIKHKILCYRLFKENFV